MYVYTHTYITLVLQLKNKGYEEWKKSTFSKLLLFWTRFVSNNFIYTDLLTGDVKL